MDSMFEDHIVPEFEGVPDHDVVVTPDPQCAGWRRKGNLLWWEEPFCCYKYGTIATTNDAESACYDNGVENGRLPYIDELRSLIQNCDNTMDEKKCAITNKVSNNWDKWTPECKGCEQRESGGYSVFGDKTWFWSKTKDALWSDTVLWGVDFAYASIGRYMADTKTGSVRCVQEVPLNDAYGNPSWQSTCPEDTRDDVVELEEYPDYDYLPCAERQEEVWPISVSIGTTMEFDLFAGFTYFTGPMEMLGDSQSQKDFSKLTGLRCIDGDIRISSTDELESLHGLESLIRGGENLDIEGNESLSDISALSGITGTKGELTLYGCPLMGSLEGLHNIEKAQTISIETMNALKDLNGLRGLQSVGALVIYTATQLETLAGLENLNKIGCVLQIVNTNISSFQGLSSLESVGADCEDAVIVLGNNHNLSSLEGMTSLNTISASINISYEDSLEDLYGLEQITSIDGDITMEYNVGLLSLAGIGNLRTIGGSIAITGNAYLTDISSLYNLEFLSGDLNFSNNIRLPACQCEHLRSLLEAKGWAGIYDFSGTDTTATCE